MSMSADLGLMDFLFEKDDLVLNQTDKDIDYRNCQKDIEGIAVENWSTNPGDFFESILNFEDQPFEKLNDDDPLPTADIIEMWAVPASASSSDSGVSSDQQLSPMLHEVEEEDTGDLLPCLSNNSESNQSETSHVCGDHESSVLEDIEVGPSVFDILNTGCLEEVKVEDNQAIFSMNVLPPLQNAAQNSCFLTTSSPLRQLNSVKPVSGNPRSILLPVSLKDVKDIKTIKIIHASSQNATRKQQFVRRTHITTDSRATVQTTPIIVESISQQDDLSSMGSSKGSMLDEMHEESDSQYPRLQLTPEEKRLIEKEGVMLPSHYPLTKHEERELKRIRRKIRNKISAQDSRKRKKEYIDGLEERVKQCSEENLRLVQRIKALQTQNQTLTTQLRGLQATSAKTEQPLTCLMVLLLSMAFVLAPNLRLNQSSTSNSDSQKDPQPDNKTPPHAGHSRSLLEFPVTEDGTFSGFNQDEEEKFMSDMAQLLQQAGDRDCEPPPQKRSRIDENPSLLSLDKKYIVPPVLEDGHISNILEKTLGEEMKLNVSNDGEMRTVVLQVPKEQ